MRRYRALVFDLYGTLADIRTDEGRPALWREAAAFYSSYGAAYTPASLRTRYEALVSRAAAAAESAAGPGEYPEIDLLPVFGELFPAGADPEAVRDAAWRFRRASTTHLRLYAGARELLRSLREDGRQIVLLTNAQRCFTAPELRLLGIDGAFDGVYISSDLGWKKPDRRVFSAMLEGQGLSPADCLMVGNDPVCDAAGAKAAGMDVWYIRSALSPADAPPPEAVAADYRQTGMDLKRLRRALLA